MKKLEVADIKVLQLFTDVACPDQWENRIRNDGISVELVE